MAISLKSALLKFLDMLEKIPVDQLMAERQLRLASFGEYSEGKG